MRPPVFVSIVSANYLAYAITLMQSLRRHHPEAPRYVVLADEPETSLDFDPELFTLVAVRELLIPQLEHFAFRYSVLEFNTAIKPYAMQWVAERHPAQPIAYVDPDIYVLAPLQKVFNATSEGALAVVTPHITAPITDDRHPDERTFLRVGTYNLGFIALGPHPKRADLLSWWAERLAFNAYVDLEAGLFTDQRWVDLIPGLFPDVRILRDPGYNLAYWNLMHRPISRDQDGAYRAAGEQLAFVHFSGVQVRRPEIFSVHQNRFDANSIGELRPIYDAYLAALTENGYERFARIPYRWARLRDGTYITPEMREIFRHRFDVGRSDFGSDPFGIPGQAFEEETPALTKFSRFALRAYPRLRTMRWFRWAMNGLAPRARWALRSFFTRQAIPVSLRAAHAEARAPGEGYPMERPTSLEGQLGANVIGYFQGEFGVAEAGRALVRSARAAGIDITMINVSGAATAREQDSRHDHELGHTAVHPINIVCVNADQTDYVFGALGDRVVGGRYNIGYWAWELPRFPTAWDRAIDLVDEIWAPTDFVRDSIRRATTKRVVTVPEAVDVALSTRFRRSDFDLPEAPFMFLGSFDFASFVQRKNPWAAIRSFQQAFPAADATVALTIKTTNGQRHQSELNELKASVEGDSRIRVIDGFLSREEMTGLLSVADAYVSLHRSEGFGLGIAESMALGKPVIATAYSGNLEFMDASNSCLVGYKLVAVRPGEYPFADDQVWADPDEDHAAYYMRRLVQDSAYRSGLGRRAQEHLTNVLSATSIGDRIAVNLLRVTSEMRG